MGSWYHRSRDRRDNMAGIKNFAINIELVLKRVCHIINKGTPFSKLTPYILQNFWFLAHEQKNQKKIIILQIK